MTITRLLLRQYVSSLIGDLIFLGTAEATSSTAQLVDADMPWLDDDAIVNHWVYIHTGTGITEERAVKQYMADSSIIIPHTAFTATIGATSQYEVHKVFQVDVYNKAIDGVIRSMRNVFLPEEDQTSTTIAANTYSYSIPSGFATISAIYMEGPDDRWDERIPDKHWIVRRDASKIEFNADGAWVVGRVDQILRIVGQARQAVTVTDASTIDDVLTEYIAHAAAMALLLRRPFDPQDSEGYQRKLAIMQARLRTLEADLPRRDVSARAV